MCIQYNGNTAWMNTRIYPRQQQLQCRYKYQLLVGHKTPTKINIIINGNVHFHFRRMFPHIVLSIEGLESDTDYSVVLEIIPADQRRYKFINNHWLPVGMADPGPEVKAVTHPDSPSRGSFWAQNRPSFSKVRLTNNKESSDKECADGNVSTNITVTITYICKHYRIKSTL